MNADNNTHPVNDKNQPHGYWKVRFLNKILNEGEYINNKQVGLWIYYFGNGEISMKEYYIR